MTSKPDPKDTKTATTEQVPTDSVGVYVCPPVCSDVAVALRGTTCNVLFAGYTNYNRIDGTVESKEECAIRAALAIKHLHTGMLVDKMFTYAAIQESGPDVLQLLSEETASDSKELKELRDAVLVSYTPRTYTGDVESRGAVRGTPKGDGCAIIALKSVFTRGCTDGLNLPEDLKDAFKEPRVALIQQLKLKSDGSSSVTVVSLHLAGPPAAHALRKTQFEYIMQRVQEMKPSGPVVIMGDYNEHDADCVKQLDVVAAKVKLTRVPLLHRNAKLIAAKAPLFTSTHGLLGHVYVSDAYAAQVQAEVDIPDCVLLACTPADTAVPDVTPKQKGMMSQSAKYQEYCHIVPYGTKAVLWPSDHFAIGLYPRYVPLG